MKIFAPRVPVPGHGGLASGGLPDVSPPTSSAVRSLRPKRFSRRRTLRRNLRNSVADCTAYSLMVGMGETYFPAFALALGLGQIVSGLVASVPLLIGAVLQLISPYAVRWLGSNRRWCVLCVLLQGLSFLPLVGAALVGELPAWALFGFVALYWAGGLGATPAWQTWMETVVPYHVRAPFFAMRTRFGQGGVLVGFLAGGFSLQYGKQHGIVLTRVAAIFAVAFVCRMISARFLSRQTESAQLNGPQLHVGFGELLGRIRAGSSERLLTYFLAVQMAVQISGPYFSPFMLGQMKISYLHFVALLAVSFLAKIVALPACGRLATLFGARRLLWLGGIGIMPVSGSWLYASEFWQLVMIQFLGGVVWAAYELAMLLMFFESVRKEERTSILTMFNLGNSVALALGSILGGCLLKILGESREAYLFLFAVSSFARAGALLVLRFFPGAELTLREEENELVDPLEGTLDLARPQVDEPEEIAGPVRRLASLVSSGRDRT
ncbi:MAG: MFS transporter [Planctomycetaceae bacterium]